MDVRIDTRRHMIAARQKVVYTNNTTKPLAELYFHIYPHRKYTEQEIRFMYRYAGYFKAHPFPEGFQGGDLKVKSVACAGKPLTYIIEGKDETILKIPLDTPLMPGNATEIEMAFTVDIPHSYGRFGWHRDVISLARWYPILSVADENGWHNYPFYIYHQPFFSDAAYYSIKITLPQAEQLAATGYVKGQEFNADGTKTVYLETEFPVRDFALGISARFRLYRYQQGDLTVNSYYLPGDHARAQEAAHYAGQLMQYYGQRFGEYPHKEFSIVPSFLAYGGCQSSCLIFIDTRVYKLPGLLERYFDFLISHETGHQWFYNLIGSDEYKEMFLDEGMNSFWILKYLEHKYGPEASVIALSAPLSWFIPSFSFRDSTIARYLYLAKNGLDGPVIGELSSFQEPSSIFALTYGKGAAVLQMLEAYVGSDVLERIMRRYTKEYWLGNISLKQFIAVCNEEAAEDLTWFFEKWLTTKETCDYAVKAVEKERIILENKGSLQMPVRTKVVFDDNSEKVYAWDGQASTMVIPVSGSRRIKEVSVDPEEIIVLDMDRTNNYWPRRLVLKPVPWYFFAYEIPALLPRDSRTLAAGPILSGSSLGAAASLQQPFDAILKLSADYDFNQQEVESRLGYELSHVGNKQTAIGLEIFNRESDTEKQDLTGGKLYLRRELWPASYGLFDLNDHVSIYLVRNQKLDSSTSLTGKEDMRNLPYRKRQEAIIGISGSIGRYGPYADPDCGWKMLAVQESAGHFLGGREAFWRSSLELDNYRLLLPRHNQKVATRIKLGWAEPSDKDLFELGGPDGLRGFSRKTVQGAHMMLGSLEYRMPIARDVKMYFFDNIFCLDNIQGVGFFDAGKAWGADFSGDSFKKNAGLGLRFHFDIIGFLEKMVVRFDAAWPVGEHKAEPHFWLGLSQAF